MNNDDYLELKQNIQKYEEKSILLTDKKMFVKMLDSCISSSYDFANVLFAGNVVSNGINKNYGLNNECLRLIIKQTKIEILNLEDEINEMSVRRI